eukprot:3117898-Pleurochrysis_carterae.AAC.1
MAAAMSAAPCGSITLPQRPPAISPHICGCAHLTCVRLLHPQQPDRLVDLGVRCQHRLGQLADLPSREVR